MRYKRDESALNCEPRDSIHSQEGGLCIRAVPQTKAMLAQPTRLRSTAAALRTGTGRPLAMSVDGSGPIDPIRPIRVGQGLLVMPFDALRFQYAGAVMAGLVQRSILASGKLERALDVLEKLVLGPLARQR